MPKMRSSSVLVGILAFFDPPREDAGAVLEALRADGIEVKILTGDNELVTRHICEQVGLDGREIVLGDEVDGMSDSALQQIAERTTIFARVSPAQKNRVMLALKAHGHAVGFLGNSASTTHPLCMLPTWVSQWQVRLMSPKMRLRSFCSSAV